MHVRIQNEEALDQSFVSTTYDHDGNDVIERVTSVAMARRRGEWTGGAGATFAQTGAAIQPAENISPFASRR